MKITKTLMKTKSLHEFITKVNINLKNSFKNW